MTPHPSLSPGWLPWEAISDLQDRWVFLLVCCFVWGHFVLSCLGLNKTSISSYGVFMRHEGIISSDAQLLLRPFPWLVEGPLPVPSQFNKDFPVNVHIVLHASLSYLSSRAATVLSETVQCWQGGALLLLILSYFSCLSYLHFFRALQTPS